VCPDSTDDDEGDGSGSRAASVDDLDVTELSRSHSLPSHILHLRHVESDVTGHLRNASSVSVHSISTVLRGSQFGPFNCHLADRLQTSSSEDSAAASEECRLEASFVLVCQLTSSSVLNSTLLDVTRYILCGEP